MTFPTDVNRFFVGVEGGEGMTEGQVAESQGRTDAALGDQGDRAAET